jgi:hypothetical protein
VRGLDGIGAIVSGELLWEGEAKSITAAATGGKVVSLRYRVTTEFVYVNAGILSSKEEQVPLWAIRDVDVSQSIIQKARGVGDLRIRLEANDYTGKPEFTLENIENPKQLRDLINTHVQKAIDFRRNQFQTVNYSGAAPVHSMSTASAAPSDDPIEKIVKLGALLQAGLLSQDEFDAQKAKLLS